MNIETVLTPNPETLKFMVDKTYIFQSGIEIKNEKETFSQAIIELAQSINVSNPNQELVKKFHS